MQTTDGGDPTTLRWDNKTQSQVVLEVQEEASTAHNLAHTTEVVGYMAQGFQGAKFHVNKFNVL